MNASASSGAGDWQIISYEANVNGSACSLHLDDRPPYLPEAGRQATVVCSTRGPRLQGKRHTRVAGFGRSLFAARAEGLFQEADGKTSVELREMLTGLGHQAVEVTDVAAIRGAIPELHEGWGGFGMPCPRRRNRPI